MDSSYTTEYGLRLSGWQGNAMNNLSAISQEIPSGSIISHAAVCDVFLAKLLCATCSQFTVPDGIDSTLATHTAARHIFWHTHAFYLFSSTILLMTWACTHRQQILNAHGQFLQHPLVSSSSRFILLMLTYNQYAPARVTYGHP